MIKKLAAKVIGTVIAVPLIIAAMVGYTAGVAVTATEIGKGVVEGIARKEYDINTDDEQE